MKRFLALLRRFFPIREPERAQTTDEQMAALKRELDRLLDGEGSNG